ncbi:hypothetical protein IMG5_083460, partial [Ichthyophthirius multifiliis]
GIFKKNNCVNMNECYGNGDDQNSENRELEMPTYQKLQEIYQNVDYDFENYIQGIPEYINKLFEIFQELEDLEEYEKIHLVYSIIRKIIFSNEQKLIVFLMKEENFENCLGVFEF